MTDSIQRLASRTVVCPDCHFRGERVREPQGCERCHGTGQRLDPRFDGLRRECPSDRDSHNAHAMVGAFGDDAPPPCCEGRGWTLIPEAEAGDALMAVAEELCNGSMTFNPPSKEGDSWGVQLNCGCCSSDASRGATWVAALAAAIEAALGGAA